MSVVFTQHAIERMRELELSSHFDLAPLLSAVERVSSTPEMLSNSPRVSRLRDGNLVLRVGRVRAILTRDPEVPERLVVASIYEAGDDATDKAAGRISDASPA